jgi:Arm DNA-binding domain
VVLGRHPAMSPAQARDEARKVLGDVARGIDPAAERAAERQRDLKERAEHTFESFICTEYRPWGKAHLRDYTLAEGRLKSCFGDLYPKKLDRITQWLVEKWRSERLRGGISPVTVNRDVAELRTALDKAVQWGFLVVHTVKATCHIENIPVLRWHYRLPPLDVCRKHFETLVGLQGYDWEGVELAA